MNPASSLMSIHRVTRSPKGARSFHVTNASWTFIPGAFFSVPAIVSAGSSLNRFGQSVWKKNSRVLKSVPPTMRRIRRRNRFFVVKVASGAPAISNCGCARMPNWMLALEFSTRSGARRRRERNVRVRVRRRRHDQRRRGRRRLGQPRPAPRLRPTSPAWPAWPAWRPRRIRRSTPGSARMRADPGATARRRRVRLNPVSVVCCSEAGASSLVCRALRPSSAEEYASDDARQCERARRVGSTSHFTGACGAPCGGLAGGAG